MSKLSDDSTPQLEIFFQYAQAGNKEAFAKLFIYYSPEICRYLAGFVSNRADRDDLAQETFLRAWKYLYQVRAASSFKAWLYRIATNVAAEDRRRQQQRTTRQRHLEDTDDFESPVRFEEYIAEKELVLLALQEVPKRYRICLLLEVLGKLSRSDIAEIVHIDEGSVGTYIAIARKGLHQAYDRLEKGQYGTEERRLEP